MKLSQIQTQCDEDQGLFIIEQININEDNGVHFEYSHRIHKLIYTLRSLAQIEIDKLEKRYINGDRDFPVISFSIIELTL